MVLACDSCVGSGGLYCTCVVGCGSEDAEEGLSQGGWRAAVARRVFGRLQLERRRVEARVRLAAREAEEAGKREARKLSHEKAQWRPKGKPKRRRGGVVPAGEDGGH